MAPEIAGPPEEGPDAERLSALRRALYRRGAGEQDVAAYQRAAGPARPAAADAVPVVAASVVARRRRGSAVALAGLLVLAASLAVVVSRPPRPPEPAPVLARAIAVGVDDVGLAAVRREVGSGAELVPASVTAAALDGVPAIAAARSLAESDLVAAGRGAVVLQDLDRFERQDAATVLVVCERSARYGWTLSAERDGAPPALQRTGTGSCGRLSAATVALPVGLRRTRLVVSVPPHVRFFAVLLTTATGASEPDRRSG